MGMARFRDETRALHPEDLLFNRVFLWRRQAILQ